MYSLFREKEKMAAGKFLWNCYGLKTQEIMIHGLFDSPTTVENRKVLKTSNLSLAEGQESSNLWFSFGL